MVIYHPEVRRGLNGVLRYYEDEGGVLLADRFFDASIDTVNQAKEAPRKFHPAEKDPVLRRVQIEKFPYHFLYREMDYGIRVSVLRHDKRHPSFGMRRR